MSRTERSNRKRREWTQAWCPSPAFVRGHKVPCSRTEGHEGVCWAVRSALREHDCRANGCFPRRATYQPLPPATEHRLQEDDDE